MELNCPQTKPFELLDDLGIGIKEINEQQRHIGILYKLDGGEVKFCHLAFHYRLRDDDPSPSYCWADAGLDAINKRVVAALCALVARNCNNIPYGLDGRWDCFDPTTGAYRPQKIGKGLTCATFVLAVFGSLGIVLVNADEWPSRPSDMQWQESIIEALKQDGASSEHVAAMRDDIGSARFRPEEVAGAVTRPEYPVGFQEAEALAKIILEGLTGHR